MRKEINIRKSRELKILRQASQKPIMVDNDKSNKTYKKLHSLNDRGLLDENKTKTKRGNHQLVSFTINRVGVKLLHANGYKISNTNSSVFASFIDCFMIIAAVVSVLVLVGALLLGMPTLINALLFVAVLAVVLLFLMGIDALREKKHATKLN